MPTNESWSLKIIPNFISGITSWSYQEESSQIYLSKSEPLTISYFYNEDPIAKFDWLPSNPAPNMEITFDGSDSVDPDGEITLYEWDWNDDDIYDVSSSSPIITHNWSTQGDYPVTLRVTDDENATDTKEHTIHVENYPPSIMITSPGMNETVNLTVLISGLSSDTNGNDSIDLVEVRIDDTVLAMGSGRNKRTAETEAARAALQQISFTE